MFLFLFGKHSISLFKSYLRLQVGHLSFDVGECGGGRRVKSHVREHQPLLVVVLAEDLVLAEVVAVPDAESVETKRKVGSVVGFQFGEFSCNV